MICHITWKTEKMRYRLGDNDVINLQAIKWKYTFSSILQVLWPVALKRGTLRFFMLMMTNIFLNWYKK